jgi:beta-galactosidase/beta-glucuronidase
MNHPLFRPLLLAILALSAPRARAADWKPAAGPLMTRWAKDVNPDKVLPEYPRPQLVRERWQNLNGLWQLEFGKDGDAPPVGRALAEQILVPFPVESALSGVMKRAERLWYRKTFRVPDAWKGSRVLIHFGAVDWESQVWLNGKELGTHRGGYDAFSYDLTGALKPEGDQELIVRVFDPTDKGTQPRGKQVNKPGGIFYTPTTGIWQTVWLEPVPETRVRQFDISTDIDHNTVSVVSMWDGERDGLTMVASALDGDRKVGEASTPLGTTRNQIITLAEAPKLWTPETPFLYGLKVEIRRGAQVVDSVSSYFGMRKIEVARDEKGVNRIKLNGKFVFQVGPLDQGFWPDGLYTAPTDDALKYDIEITKTLGFNMTRKHVKVEPDRWYYWCDRLGLLVWQDMVAGDKGIGPNDPDLKRSPESAAQYEVELKAMIDGLRNHPSIIMWVVFNEGWGQFDTGRITKWTKKYDPTRLVDCASGWTDRAGVGDVHDLHSYPHPAAPPLEPKRAGVLGEFGGLSLGIDGHTWEAKIWGYQAAAGKDDLTRKYERLLREAWELKDAKGLNAVVYTQLTDVETEANGLLTYDRAVIKPSLERVAAVNRGDYSKVPVSRVVVPTSREAAQLWRYTTERPTKGWSDVGFDDSSWKQGPGGFGTEGTPGAVVRTTWNTPDIWARRSFTLGSVDPSTLLILSIHDEDAEYYLNGVLAATVKGYVGSDEEIPISAEARATLKPGKNEIAVHCHQTAGGQSIDAGLIELKEPRP